MSGELEQYKIDLNRFLVLSGMSVASLESQKVPIALEPSHSVCALGPVQLPTGEWVVQIRDDWGTDVPSAILPTIIDEGKVARVRARHGPLSKADLERIRSSMHEAWDVWAGKRSGVAIETESDPTPIIVEANR